MEFRLLEYFLAVAREQNITAAAESLHISQPALSTQLKAMEMELGKQLLIRGVKGSRKVVLTEEGMILRKRAEEMLSLVKSLWGMYILAQVKQMSCACSPKLQKSYKKRTRIFIITLPAAMQNMCSNIWIRG